MSEPTEPTPPPSPESIPEAPGAPSTPSTGSPFIGDAGPGYSEHGVPPPLGPEDEAGLLAAFALDVSEEQVRDFLLVVGDGVHSVAGVGDLDWVMTQRDLERIVPPATRIINRYEPAQRVMGQSDFLAIAFGSGLYAWRSMLERQAVLDARAANQPTPANPSPGQPPTPGDPIAGAAMPEGYVPLADQLRATRPEEGE